MYVTNYANYAKSRYIIKALDLTNFAYANINIDTYPTKTG